MKFYIHIFTKYTLQQYLTIVPYMTKYNTEKFYIYKITYNRACFAKSCAIKFEYSVPDIKNGVLTPSTKTMFFPVLSFTVLRGEHSEVVVDKHCTPTVNIHTKCF